MNDMINDMIYSPYALTCSNNNNNDNNSNNNYYYPILAYIRLQNANKYTIFEYLKKNHIFVHVDIVHFHFLIFFTKK